MEFHLAGHVRTLKDFLIHLGIVTLGILIALGLEELAAAHHRSKVAREAVAGFRRELADNRAQVEEVLSNMPELRAKIRAQVDSLSALGSAESKSAVPIAYPGIYFDLVSSASWDTAIATQALIDIPYADAKRYSEAYGVFHIFMDEERIGLATWQDLRSFGEDAALLTPDRRRALIEQLRRYESFTYVIDVVGKGALQSCDRALR
ncbi:MAG: hypothetical protein WCB10_09845 [Steroidobacteraceae bacterium]